MLIPRDDIDTALSSLNLEGLNDYFGSVLEDLENWRIESLTEALSELLIGYGISEDEDEAIAFCSKLHQTLTNGKDSPSSTEGEHSVAVIENVNNDDKESSTDGAVKLLTAPISMADRVRADDATRLRQTALLNEGESSSAAKYMSLTTNVDVKDRSSELESSAGYLKQETKRLAAEEAMTLSWDPLATRNEAQEGLVEVYLEARRHGVGCLDVNVENLTLLAPDNRVLLDNTVLRLTYGRRYGLVGRNGIGKTQLLRSISSYRLDNFPSYMKVLHVEQEIVGDDRTVLDTVLSSDLERVHLLQREKDLIDDDNIAEYEYIQNRLQETEAWSAEARASAILAGLNITPEMQCSPTRLLSGGWRMRVSLAAALFVKPDLVLLDEPTNHLDFPTVLWLEEYLRSYQATVVIVSHDRGFLNNVVTDIILLRNRGLHFYRGDYSTYHKTFQEQYVAQKRAYEAQQMEIKHIQDFIHTFYNEKRSSAQDRKTKLVESRKKTLERMIIVPNPDESEDPQPISFYFPEPKGVLKRDTIIQTDELSFAYPPRKDQYDNVGRGRGRDKLSMLLSNVTVSVDVNARIGMLGANGSGKSTLINLFTRAITPSSGTLHVNANVRIGLFAQHHVDAMDLRKTPIQILRDNFPDIEVIDARRYLGKFGIVGTKQTRLIGTLSGGEKSRIACSLIVKRQPHFIIFDEPTNHLDMETIDALISAIHKYQGAVLVVSHDQYFLDQVTDIFWAVGCGKVKVVASIEEAKKFSYS